jgi:catechol 2,3-dioxygenase-like lactoylglutathione lyase family enzyme
MHIKSINAVTLAVHDMSRSVRFYTALGFSMRYGGEHAAFTSLHAGSCYLNLIAQPADRSWSWWGRVIFHVSDVDAFHRRAIRAGAGTDHRARGRPVGRAVLPYQRSGRP